MYQTEFKEYKPTPIERLTYRNWQPRDLFALPMISGRCSNVVIDLCSPQKGVVTVD